jgi:hypothetical protein
MLCQHTNIQLCCPPVFPACCADPGNARTPGAMAATPGGPDAYGVTAYTPGGCAVLLCMGVTSSALRCRSAAALAVEAKNCSAAVVRSAAVAVRVQYAQPAVCISLAALGWFC